MSKDIHGQELTEREMLVMLTDDDDCGYATKEAVEARGHELAEWLYSNVPETFVNAMLARLHERRTE